MDVGESAERQSTARRLSKIAGLPVGAVSSPREVVHESHRLGSVDGVVNIHFLVIQSFVLADRQTDS
jgi:hypothetical protein